MQEVLDSILPLWILDRLSAYCNESKLYEIRLRVGSAVVVNYDSNYCFLSNNGLALVSNNCIMLDSDTLQQIVFRAADFSLYSATKQINNGYITIRGGIRIGMCGQVVYEDNKIQAIKDFSSINIRLPHQIIGCAMPIWDNLWQEKTPLNTLLVSPPGAGKTTMLRDLARAYSIVEPLKNVLVIDERCEIAAMHNGIAQLSVGLADVMSSCIKDRAFEYAIRAMRPDIIVTDELAGIKDWDSIGYALSCGCCVVASIHASGIEELKHKEGFLKVLNNKQFDRFVVLSSRDRVGTIEGVFNKELKQIA